MCPRGQNPEARPQAGNSNCSRARPVDACAEPDHQARDSQALNAHIRRHLHVPHAGPTIRDPNEAFLNEILCFGLVPRDEVSDAQKFIGALVNEILKRPHGFAQLDAEGTANVGGCSFYLPRRPLKDLLAFYKRLEVIESPFEALAVHALGDERISDLA